MGMKPPTPEQVTVLLLLLLAVLILCLYDWYRWERQW